MSINVIVFLLNKKTKHISYAGKVPATYATITGLTDVDYSTLRDLAIFGDDYKDMGFLTEEDALASGALPKDIAEAKAGAWELGWNSLEEERQNLIQDQRWRLDRNSDELELDMIPSEDVGPVRVYIQAIRDLPAAQPDPFNIVWPVVPALPAKAA